MKSQNKFQRTNFNSLPRLQKSNSTVKETHTKGDKFFKFQNMSKLIVNKIDDMLTQYPNHDSASTSITPYSEVSNSNKGIMSRLSNIDLSDSASRKSDNNLKKID